jgi:hypothetical protein
MASFTTARARTVLLLLALSILLAAGAQATPAAAQPASGSIFYVDNRPWSNCSNAGSGASPAAPWCDFAPASGHSFGPGDTLLLARGATWNQELVLTGAGTPGAYATLDAYGNGPRPRIIRNGAPTDRAIRMYNPSYWRVRNLEIGAAGAGILVYFTTLFHRGLEFRDIFVHDIRGIHQGDRLATGRDDCATTDGIWNSAGIVITGNLLFSSTDYALADVVLAEIEGTRNQASISFDWCNGKQASDGDGHNLVQNVLLTDLFLHDDRGPAVGCDEGLRLLNMRDVLVMNALLDKEAGCYSPTGTAAIIFGRLRNVTVVNSIVRRVPDTNSFDMTGFDYECCTGQVRVLNSYIADNAGPGVEITANGIFDSELAGNLFLRNGGGAVKRINQGFPPTGTIRDNLYWEPQGFLTSAGGGDFSAITLSNNLTASAAAALFHAANDFMGAQGERGWTYQYSSNNGGLWQDLSYYAASQSWRPATGLRLPQIRRFEQYPAACAGCWVARTWTARLAGVLSIRGRLLKSDATGGDGVTARITRNGVPIWGPQALAAGDQLGIETNLDSLQVSAGDVLRFELSSNGSSTHDLTSWAPAIAYVEAMQRRVGRR